MNANQLATILKTGFLLAKLKITYLVVVEGTVTTVRQNFPLDTIPPGR